jgi:hypothetical protein
MQTVCTFCSAKVKVKDELVGRSVKCPKCAKAFKVAAEEVEAEPAAKTATKKAAPWSAKPDADSKSAPWDKGKKGKEEEKAPAKKGPPAKKSKKHDDDDDDDEEDSGGRGKGVSFGDLLAQTTLSDSTRKLIQNELSLREQGVWVGQPCPKIMTVRSIPKCFAAGAVMLVLSIVGGGALSQAVGEAYLIFVIIGAVLLWCITVLVLSVIIMFMDRRKALGTAYVITNKRCIVFNAGWFFGPSPVSYYPDLLQHMRPMGSWVFGDGAGDLVFRSVTTVTKTYHQRGGVSTSVSTVYYGFLGIRRMEEIQGIIINTLLYGGGKKKKKKKKDDDDDDDDD